MTTVPIRHYAGAPYIRVDELPPEDQAPFSAWVFRQTRPVVPHELDANCRPAACAYAWDHTRWLAENKPAALADPFDT
jgi:hypothetical protein